MQLRNDQSPRPAALSEYLLLYRQSVALPSPRSGAWHQRVPVVRIARGWARDRFFRLLETVAKTDDARAIVHGTLDDSVACRPAVPAAALRSTVRPYADLGHAAAAAVERHPVFITARFRSGSTLLWNLFRHTNRCTAFYEPLNERRWFDPSQRGTTTDATHKGVDDYWREYDGLEELGRYYNEEWTSRGLYMDAGSWNPALAAYVRLLVQRAPQRPVLQFNRIDFRLPWFRRMFPSASLIHLYRHPRDQWCSSLTDRACSTSCTIADFRNHDGFYLLTWAADLKYRFPFLEQPETSHPYRLFYLIWKLSYLFGATYADHSLRFESLIENPETELRRLFNVIALDEVDVDGLARLVEPAPPRWPQYASDEWFKSHEAACEEVLADFFQSWPSTSTSATDTIARPRLRQLEPAI